MSIFEQLLAVQEHDTHLDQLRHRHATLPERASLEQQQRAIEAHDAQTRAIQDQRDAIARDQKRIEDEVAMVEAKATDVDKTLYSGTVRSPRELQGFQDDLSSLRRRQRQLEDEVLGFMEQLEPLDDELERRTRERAGLDAAASTMAEALDAVERELDREINAAERERTDALGPVPAELVNRYENLRLQQDGIAIARLVGNSCGGCHLKLSAVEIDRLKHEPPDALVFCEECGRLLVR
jgi:predicted  nucleic acid-binding Zn-ribbon protein